MNQHVAARAAIERMRPDLIGRLGQLEVPVEPAQVNLREQRFTIQTRWIVGLFIGQTLVLLGPVPGMVEVSS